MTREYPREVRRAWERLQAAQEARRQIDDANNELQARYARENFLRALFYLNPSEIPDSVREARRRFDEDLEDHDEAIRAGDPVANARNQELMRQATDAECAAGIHRFCACRHGRKRLDATPPDEADPVTGNWFDERNAQVWGVIQSDGSVVAKGFVGDETADEDKAVHPAGSLAYYSPQRGWTNAATGHPASEGPATPPGQETDMPRHDRFGDRGPRGDRDDVADTFANQPIGSTMTLYRLDGTEASYRLTPAGGRMIPGSDTKANAKAEVERDLANLRAQPVKVHHTQGCGLCGRTDEHTHAQSEWRRFIDRDAATEEEAKRQRYDVDHNGAWTTDGRATEAERDAESRFWDADRRGDGQARDAAYTDWQAAQADRREAQNAEGERKWARWQAATAGAPPLTEDESARIRDLGGDGLDREHQALLDQRRAAVGRDDIEEAARLDVHLLAVEDERRRREQKRLEDEAMRAEHYAAKADDKWDSNPTPENAQASRDASQRADEAWRRAGRPDCIPPTPTPLRPSAAPTNGSAGGNVASIEDVRAGIAASNEHSTSALGALQQAHADLETAQGALMRATEGSGQADASEANGLLAQAVADIEVLRQQVSAAISSAEDVGNRL